MELKNLGDKICVFDEEENKCTWYVIVGYNDRESMVAFTTHYMVVQISESVWERNLKFEKVNINDAYNSEKEAREAYIKELEKERDEQAQEFNNRILKLRGGKNK